MLHLAKPVIVQSSSFISNEDQHFSLACPCYSCSEYSRAHFKAKGSGSLLKQHLDLNLPSYFTFLWYFFTFPITAESNLFLQICKNYFCPVALACPVQWPPWAPSGTSGHLPAQHIFPSSPNKLYLNCFLSTCCHVSFDCLTYSKAPSKILTSCFLYLAIYLPTISPSEGYSWGQGNTLTSVCHSHLYWTYGSGILFTITWLQETLI